MDYVYGQSNEFPLRILVPSDSVGAIIGKQGANVKNIKQKTHAKVDVNKNEPSNIQERVIAFRGQQDNCIQACREVLHIMYEDSRNKNKTNEVVLKVLAHNNFIGRIIGKGGNIINTIKKDTETNITVSSISELNAYNSERIISIKGEFDQQIRALETIYAKLCSAYENDNARGWTYPNSQYQQQQHFMQHFTPQTMMMATSASGGTPLYPTHYAQQQQQQQQQSIIPPTTNSNTSSSKYMEQPSHATTMYQPPYYQPMFSMASPYYMSYPPSTGQMVPPYPYQYGNVGTNGNPNHQHQYQQHQHSQTIPTLSQNGPANIETVHLYVPNTVIGAIIGTKGLFIKSIIHNSNASVKISPLSPHEDQNKIIERQVTISGTPEAQWKSQYYIYDKIRQEGYAGEDEVRLRAEIYVPTSLIGRLVGKGGQNVRQLQQLTGAMIKLPEDSQQTSASEVPVKIFGTFQASQFAQRRIQSIIQMSRDSINASNDDSNNNTNNNSEQSDNIILNKKPSNHSNEISTIVNGTTISDDAVVASSSIKNSDDSIATLDEKKSSDE